MKKTASIKQLPAKWKCFLALAAGGSVSICVLAGCGDETLKASESEKTLLEAFKTQHRIAIVKAKCEDNVKAKTGTKFVCDATLSQGNHVKVDAIVGKKVGEKWEISFTVQQRL